MSETYVVTCYNTLDAEFGYNCGPRTIFSGLTLTVAKFIARHMNKVSPEFMSYDVECEPNRYWHSYQEK